MKRNHIVWKVKPGFMSHFTVRSFLSRISWYSSEKSTKKNLFFKFVEKTWLLAKVKFVDHLEESSRALSVLERTSLRIKYEIEV